MTIEARELTASELAAKVLECIVVSQADSIYWEPGWIIEPHALRFELKRRFSINCSPEKLLKACTFLVPGHIFIKISKPSTPDRHTPTRTVTAFQLFRKV